MLIPIRCWTCGKPIAHLWEQYKEKVQKGEQPKEVMNSLGIERYCCRAMFLGNIELMDTVAEFKKI